MHNFTKGDLEMHINNLTYEIKKGNKLLLNNDVIIFNSSILPIQGSKNILVASRGWFGNVRSWDGINFIVLSIFNDKLIKIKQNIIDIDLDLLKDKSIQFKEFKNRIILHEKVILEGPEDPRLYYHNDNIYILVNELDYDSLNTHNKPKRLMYIAEID